MLSDRVLSYAPWIATRSYIDDCGHFSPISNTKTHEFILLEGEASKIWDALKDGVTEAELFEDFANVYSSTEISEFLTELRAAQLITYDDELDYIHQAQPDNPPSPIDESELKGFSTNSERHDEIESEAQERATRAGYLWAFFWEVTYRCNERCVHCFNPGAAHSPTDKVNRTRSELTREQAIKVLDDCVECGVFRIVFSGGEVFSSKDFFFILEEARKRHLQVHIFTNGLLLNNKRLDRLVKTWPDTVSISIYSDDQSKHDAVTNVPASLTKSIVALKSLSSRGIKTIIKAPMMKATAFDWEGIKQIGLETGSAVMFDTYISASNDGKLGPTTLNPEFHQVIELALTPGSAYYVGTKETNFGKKQLKFDETVCGAGISTIAMTPDGDISPCVALPIVVGDVLSKSVREVWAERNATTNNIKKDQGETVSGYTEKESLFSLAEWRQITLKDYEECGTHARCHWCNKCPGASLNETGDALKASSIQCRIAAARMEVATRLDVGSTPAQIMAELLPGKREIIAVG
jgi:MoaA/NifB/PqqE/SkfB family radical SAM enzyme